MHQMNHEYAPSEAKDAVIYFVFHSLPFVKYMNTGNASICAVFNLKYYLILVVLYF